MIFVNNLLFESNPLVNKVNLQTYINHELASYNKGNKDGKTLAKQTGVNLKNTDLHLFNFKSYLDGLCNSYTSYENSKISKSFSLFNFSFKNSDCVFRSSDQLHHDSDSSVELSNIESDPDDL